MANDKPAVELDEQLLILEQNFFRELRKITEQRFKLEKSSLSPCGIDFSEEKDIKSKTKNTKSASGKVFSVRLETPLGVRLAKSRGTSDELEDKLQETKMTYEDKLLTVDRIKKELDRREDILVRSVQEIETYLRAIFYIKKKAKKMHEDYKKTSEELKVTLQKLEISCDIYERKRNIIVNTIAALQPSKISLEKIISDLPSYSSIEDLIEYYLVLQTLQNDLLDQEDESTKAENSLVAERQQVEELKKRIPMTIVSKESEIRKLESKLRNIKSDTAQLEEQIDDTTWSTAKDGAAWYDIQRWIKKLFLASAEIRPPGPDERTTGTINMIDRIKDFVADGLEMVESLKKRDARL